VSRDNARFTLVERVTSSSTDLVDGHRDRWSRLKRKPVGYRLGLF
jgi:hypothetical protein